MAIGSIIGMGLSLAGGLIGASSAKKAARAAAREKSRLNAKLSMLENTRQEIINPYEGIQDTSSLITNPFANLGVATKAAEIQMEETDLALASTLDNLRATGASAGGATALAQAALRSKKGIAASIESQEAQNEKMRASGEQQRQQQLRAEQVRLQQADVAGEQFVFGMREQREMQQLDRTAALLGQATQASAQARADETAAITGMFGSLAQLAPGAFNPSP
jgi:hypothetical protein